MAERGSLLGPTCTHSSSCTQKSSSSSSPGPTGGELWDVPVKALCPGARGAEIKQDFFERSSNLGSLRLIKQGLLSTDSQCSWCLKTWSRSLQFVNHLCFRSGTVGGAVYPAIITSCRVTTNECAEWNKFQMNTRAHPSSVNKTFQFMELFPEFCLFSRLFRSRLSYSRPFKPPGGARGGTWRKSLWILLERHLTSTVVWIIQSASDWPLNSSDPQRTFNRDAAVKQSQMTWGGATSNRVMSRLSPQALALLASSRVSWSIGQAGGFFLEVLLANSATENSRFKGCLHRNILNYYCSLFWRPRDANSQWNIFKGPILLTGVYPVELLMSQPRSSACALPWWSVTSAQPDLARDEQQVSAVCSSMLTPAEGNKCHAMIE